MNVELEYENGRYINFEMNDLNYICGVNKDWMWQIYRSLWRLSNNKNLNDLEENIYGEDGIGIFVDGKKMSSNSLKIYCIKSREDIVRQCKFDKDSLMYRMIASYEEKIEVSKLLEIINDDILRLELKMQFLLSEISDNIVPNLKLLNFRDVLKNHLKLNYYDNEIVYPIDMISINVLLDEYCKLLENNLMSEKEEVWIVLYNPETFLYDDSMDYINCELKMMTQRYPNFKIIYLTNEIRRLNYSFLDIEKTVFLGDDFEEFPPFDILKKNVSDNYPEELECEDSDILEAFINIIPLIGKYCDYYPIPNKYMVLLKIMNNLMGYNRIDNYSQNRNLSIFEENFLRE